MLSPNGWLNHPTKWYQTACTKKFPFLWWLICANFRLSVVSRRKDTDHRKLVLSPLPQNNGETNIIVILSFRIRRKITKRRKYSYIVRLTLPLNNKRTKTSIILSFHLRREATTPPPKTKNKTKQNKTKTEKKPRYLISRWRRNTVTFFEKTKIIVIWHRLNEITLWHKSATIFKCMTFLAYNAFNNRWCQVTQIINKIHKDGEDVPLGKAR